VKENH